MKFESLKVYISVFLPCPLYYLLSLSYISLLRVTDHTLNCFAFSSQLPKTLKMERERLFMYTHPLTHIHYSRHSSFLFIDTGLQVTLLSFCLENVNTSGSADLLLNSLSFYLSQKKRFLFCLQFWKIVSLDRKFWVERVLSPFPTCTCCSIVFGLI